MSAAYVQKPVPLYLEAGQFWEDLVGECGRLVEAMNSAARLSGIEPNALIRFTSDPDIILRKDGIPSTEIRISLSFHSWGPFLKTEITGAQASGRRFSTSQLEIPIACDLDGSVVAIFDEGRSFSARDLTRFLMQSFRRCYPDVTLPY